MLRKPSDSKIIEGLKVQDEKILNYVYDNYYQTVKSHVIKNSGSDDDVSDVLQESVIALYKQAILPDFNLTTDLKGYFFGIVRNIWNAQLRMKNPNNGYDLDEILDTDTEEFDDQILERVVTDAFQKLQSDCQKILNLYAKGKSYEEIALKMKFKNEAYARRKKFLCKEALIEIIKGYPEFPEIQRFLK